MQDALRLAVCAVPLIRIATQRRFATALRRNAAISSFEAPNPCDCAVPSFKARLTASACEGTTTGARLTLPVSWVLISVAL